MTCSVGLKAQFGPFKPNTIAYWEQVKLKKVGDLSMGMDGIIYDVIVNNATKTVKHKIMSLRNLRNVRELNTDKLKNGINWDNIVKQDPLWKADNRWKMPVINDVRDIQSNRNLVFRGLKQALTIFGNNKTKLDLFDCSVNINGRTNIRAGLISKDRNSYYCSGKLLVFKISAPNCKVNHGNSFSSNENTVCIPIDDVYLGSDEFHINGGFSSKNAYFVRLVKEEEYKDPIEVERLKKLEPQRKTEENNFWSNVKAKKIGDGGIKQDGIIYGIVYNSDSSQITHKIIAFQNLRDVLDGRQQSAIVARNWPKLISLRSLPNSWKMPVFNDLKMVATNVDLINEGLKTQKKRGIKVDLFSCNMDVKLATGRVWTVKRGGLICSDHGQLDLESTHYYICPISPRQCVDPNNGKKIIAKQVQIYPGIGEYFILFSHNRNFNAFNIRFVKEEVYNKPR
jgi:hypothetical protein